MRREIQTGYVALAIAVIAINAVISLMIATVAFKKMYIIYYERTMSIYRMIEKLADKGIKNGPSQTAQEEGPWNIWDTNKGDE